MGKSGFVFVNNYQRLQDMPPKKDVQFVINLPSGPAHLSAKSGYHSIRRLPYLAVQSRSWPGRSAGLGHSAAADRH